MSTEELERTRVYSKQKFDSKFVPQHPWGHVERVVENALKIVESLGIDSLDLNLLKAACMLHDLPLVASDHSWPIGHVLEKITIKKFLPGILNELEISQSEKVILFEAIYNHPFSIPYRHLNKNKDLYTQVLQDADSLDYFSNERELGLKKSGDRSFMYRVAGNFSKRFFIFGRKNIRLFLNFPEIANLQN